MAGKPLDSRLPVVERVQAELQLHRAEHPGAPLSIAELCRRAGVSRSSIYQSHPEILGEIRGAWPAINLKKRNRRQTNVGQTTGIPKEKYEALLLLCLELKRENLILTKRLKRASSD